MNQKNNKIGEIIMKKTNVFYRSCLMLLVVAALLLSGGVAFSPLSAAGLDNPDDVPSFGNTEACPMPGRILEQDHPDNCHCHFWSCKDRASGGKWYCYWLDNCGGGSGTFCNFHWPDELYEDAGSSCVDPFPGVEY